MIGGNLALQPQIIPTVINYPAVDPLEAKGWITSEGNTSRRMAFEAWKVIAPRPDLSDSAAEVLTEPLLVCRASGTCVTPKHKQRLG